MEIKTLSKLSSEERNEVLLGRTQYSVVFFDLECTSLKPNVGRILCCSFKPIDKPAYTFSALDRRFKQKSNYDDGKLAVAIRNELERYDIIVGHNSKMFDTKFLNARLLHQGERIKKTQYQIDTMWIVRSKSSAWSGLKAFQQFSQGHSDKTEIVWERWMEAIGWDPELRTSAMNEITTHCEADVKVLEKVYKQLVEADTVRSIRRDGGVI